MPRCPNCGKGGFKDDSAVANHMNQPTSTGCNMWVDNLVSLRDSILPSSSRRSTPPSPSSNPLAFPEDPTEMDVDSDHTAHEVEPPRYSAEPFPVGSQETYDLFPGAARIYTSGPTFMDRFEADWFSGHRSTNIYYPFASREEWELALWLLRLGLSMRAIDAFLKLSKVHCVWLQCQLQSTY